MESPLKIIREGIVVGEGYAGLPQGIPNFFSFSKFLSFCFQLFIVRRSSQPNSMAISIKLPPGTNQDIEHYLVETTIAGVHLEGSPNYFRELPFLLAYYCENGYVQIFFLKLHMQFADIIKHLTTELVYLCRISDRRGSGCQLLRRTT